jgi:hypothetical protein
LCSFLTVSTVLAAIIVETSIIAKETLAVSPVLGFDVSVETVEDTAVEIVDEACEEVCEDEELEELETGVAIVPVPVTAVAVLSKLVIVPPMLMDTLSV